MAFGRGNQLAAGRVIRGRPRTCHDLKVVVRHQFDRETREKHLESKQNHLHKGFTAQKTRKQGDCKNWLTKGNCHDIKNCPLNHPEDRRGANKKSGRGRGRGGGRGGGRGRGRGNGSRSTSRGSSRASSRGGSRGTSKGRGRGRSSSRASSRGASGRQVGRDFLQGQHKRESCKVWHHLPGKFFNHQFLFLVFNFQVP